MGHNLDSGARTGKYFFYSGRALCKSGTEQGSSGRAQDVRRTLGNMPTVSWNTGYTGVGGYCQPYVWLVYAPSQR